MTQAFASPVSPLAPAPTFDSLDPATGTVIASYPIADETQVRAAVARAREAAQWWGELGFEERRLGLRQWRRVLARRAKELAAVVTKENGKPEADAVLEIMLAIDHIAWAAKHAEKVLGRTKGPRAW